MAMLDTVLNFNGSESANKGPDWFGRPFWDMERLPGQLMGLGATPPMPDEIMVAARACSAGDSAACTTYYAWYNKNVSGGGGSCPAIPSSVSAAVMSSPSCSPQDAACVALAQQIQEYNLAVIAAANQDYNRAVCEHNKCLNGDSTDCNSRYPQLSIPPQPSYSGSAMLQHTNGVTTGYATTGASGGSGGGDASEVQNAKQSLLDAMRTLGVSGNQALMAKLDAEFTKGLSWWLSANSNYNGLAAHTATNATSTVRQWIKDLGITAPAPVKGSDGTPKVPSSSGSGQGGNTDTSNSETTEVTLASTGLSNPMLLAAGAAILFFMLKGGK